MKSSTQQGKAGRQAAAAVADAPEIGMPRRFPRVIAEKNLLKIHLSNWYVRLNVVNNRSGHIFLQVYF